MKLLHFFKNNLRITTLKGMAYTIATFCMLILMTGISHGQLTSTDGYVYLRDQYLYGNNSAYLYYNSNHSTTTQFILRDKESDMYGKLYGTGNGTNFGLVDGDNDWSYKAVKDSHTSFKIDDSEIMRLLNGGGVGIGTITVPTGYLLAVNGKVIAEEMRVKPYNFWDEVFETDYDLMSIEEKQKFTKINKHLPSFAPESEIVDEGMEVGKSFADVAKELEEAYLYIYQLNDKMKALEAQLAKLSGQSDE